MGLTNEHVGHQMLAKIKIYTLTRAELLFNLCYEIPCSSLLDTKADRGQLAAQHLMRALIVGLAA